MHIQEIFHNYSSCLTLKRIDRRPFRSFYSSIKSTCLLFTEHPLYHPLYQQICPYNIWSVYWGTIPFSENQSCFAGEFSFSDPATPTFAQFDTRIQSEILLLKSFSFIKFRILDSASTNGMLSFEYFLINVLGLEEESPFWNGSKSLFPQTSHSYPGGRRCPFPKAWTCFCEHLKLWP